MGRNDHLSLFIFFLIRSLIWLWSLEFFLFTYTFVLMSQRKQGIVQHTVSNRYRDFNSQSDVSLLLVRVIMGPGDGDDIRKIRRRKKTAKPNQLFLMTILFLPPFCDDLRLAMNCVVSLYSISKIEYRVDSTWVVILDRQPADQGHNTHFG